jgi:hypothetical protein
MTFGSEERVRSNSSISERSDCKLFGHSTPLDLLPYDLTRLLPFCKPSSIRTDVTVIYTVSGKRSPQGKTDFKFYVVCESEEFDFEE